MVTVLKASSMNCVFDDCAHARSRPSPRRILDGPLLDPAPKMALTQLLQDDDDLLYARYEVLR